jgi:hypothetical protein
LIEYILAGLLFAFGVVSATRSVREPSMDEEGSNRVLFAVHDAAKALFWFSLGGFFLAYGVTDRAPEVRWLALVPIGMAGLRLIAASMIARS